jgi:hypothetical protein
MEGEALFKERKHFWSKKELKREKIYCFSGIGGICDMSDLSTEVEKQIKKRLASNGWGYKFLGWQRILNYEESLEIAKEREWDIDDLPKCKLTTETLDNWTVEHAAKTLNGKLFAQYCKDYGIVLTECDV